MSRGREPSSSTDERSMPMAEDSANLDETLAAEDSIRPTPAKRRSVPDAGERIGRYVVLSRLGSGGMGVVFAAYDPQLDRKVALKLLRARGRHMVVAQARLQREAQALARLNHPNVVAVYDVGMHEGHVFVAMELVAGQTLGAWMLSPGGETPQPWQHVIARFESAGRGLAAAHAVGLVHRDFKPDNVMLGDDGRVRVMDFGLARARSDEPDSAEDPELSTSGLHGRSSRSLDIALTSPGAMLGTPAYMAPEQFLHAEVDARTDQFAFCITLYEALYGSRPFDGETPAELAYSVTSEAPHEPPYDSDVPAWLWRLLRRGLSMHPEDRFESMDALLRVLGSAATRRRRLRALVATSVVAVGGATLAGGYYYDRSQRRAACAAEGDAIDEVWNEASQEAVRTGLLATGVGNASTVAKQVTPWLDAQARAWREHATTACSQATLTGRWTPQQRDKAGWCLDERRVELSILLTEFSRADQDMVQMAIEAAATLPVVDTCVDQTALTSMPPPPTAEQRPRAVPLRDSLRRIGIMLGTGQTDEAKALAAEAETQAAHLAWPPLLAETKLMTAKVLQTEGAYPESEQAAIAAYMNALRSSNWHVAADAATTLVNVIGYHQARYTEGLVWAEHAAACIAHAGDPLGLREARRAIEIGLVYRTKGEYPAAESWYEDAFLLLEQARSLETLEMATLLNNMALVSLARGDRERAKQRLEHALKIRERLLGSEHPWVATVHNNLGKVHERVGDNDAAQASYLRALQTIEQSLGPGHPRAGAALTNLGSVQWMLGQTDEAERNLQRAQAVLQAALGPEHPNLASTHNSLGQLYRSLDRNAEAKTHYERALVIWEASLGPDHPHLATGLANLGRLMVQMGDLDEARRLHARALAIREKALDPDHPDVAMSLVDLGMVHASTGTHHAAKEVFARALAMQERALGPDHAKLTGALVGLGEAQLALGEATAAIETLERSTRLAASAGVHATLLAESRFALARAQWNAPEPRHARARALAEQARDGYAASGARQAEATAEVERWLAEHPVP